MINIKKQNAGYYQKNKERWKFYALKQKEYRKEYRSIHKEEVKRYNKKYQKENKKKINEYSLARYYKYHDKMKEYRRGKCLEYRRAKGILPKGGENHWNWKGGQKKCIDCGEFVKNRRKDCLRCFKCNRKWLSGERNPFWKGGITAFQKSIRNIPKYRDWRIAVFERDNFICQNCFVRGGNLEAHHKKLFISIIREIVPNYADLKGVQVKQLVYEHAPLWDISNGITLCKGCHKYTHTNS